jgi:antitoxin component of MazEF toxin-antitoxin module
MNLISVGKVKAWQLNANSRIIGVCIPKIAQENLHVEKGTSFDVKIDMVKRKIILEPISTEAAKETEQEASSGTSSRRAK